MRNGKSKNDSNGLWLNNRRTSILKINTLLLIVSFCNYPSFILVQRTSGKNLNPKHLFVANGFLPFRTLYNLSCTITQKFPILKMHGIIPFKPYNTLRFRKNNTRWKRMDNVIKKFGFKNIYFWSCHLLANVGHWRNSN